MITSELLHELTQRLKVADVEDARLEARLLTAKVLDLDPARLSPISDIVVTPEKYAAAESMLLRRINGEPLQYLLGEWSFMGLDFAVSTRVLIPRADTEVLCEYALQLMKERDYQSVLDLCCGTGCIGISIAKLGDAAVTLADISGDCLAIARKNAKKHGITATFHQTDLFSALGGQQFDLICCNPPYLTEEDMQNLQREVRHEPVLALYGGVDGLDFYRRIASEYRRHLLPNGALLLEIGSTQAETVSAMFETSKVIHDYAGNPRVVFAEAQ